MGHKETEVSKDGGQIFTRHYALGTRHTKGKRCIGIGKYNWQQAASSSQQEVSALHCTVGASFACDMKAPTYYNK
jgi:hypothetical protein